MGGHRLSICLWVQSSFAVSFGLAPALEELICLSMIPRELAFPFTLEGERYVISFLLHLEDGVGREARRFVVIYCTTAASLSEFHLLAASWVETSSPTKARKSNNHSVWGIVKRDGRVGVW